ncbi:MAG: FKBP-type peptidyl-prolyl cis-trans isomerase [Myxococcota bacterium]
MRGGIRLEDESTGTGREARLGDRVTVRYALTLNRGDVVQTVEAYRFVLGKREVVAALEYGVLGMAVGGRRRFRAGPHLAYGERAVAGIVPPNAVLRFDVTLLDVERAVERAS